MEIYSTDSLRSQYLFHDVAEMEAVIRGHPAHAVCSKRSFRLHAGGLDHIRPLVALPGEEGRELVRRAGLGIDVELGERGADLGGLQAFVDRGIEPGHDR